MIHRVSRLQPFSPTDQLPPDPIKHMVQPVFTIMVARLGQFNQPIVFKFSQQIALAFPGQL
jgi:hypothetical protein